MQAPGESTEIEHSGHQMSLLLHGRECCAQRFSQRPFPRLQIQVEFSERHLGFKELGAYSSGKHMKQV